MLQRLSSLAATFALVACAQVPPPPAATPAPAAARVAGQVEVVWLGQAAFKITAVRAEHSSILVWRNPATGKDETHPGGEPLGWIIELEDGFRIYHAGDTALFGDMRLIGERHRPDLALLPIGGNFTMDPVDAAHAVNVLLQPRAVIPMHYGANPLARGTARQFIDALGPQGAAKVHVAVPGQPLRF